MVCLNPLWEGSNNSKDEQGKAASKEDRNREKSKGDSPPRVKIMAQMIGFCWSAKMKH